MAPQFWSMINFKRPEKGVVFLAPPKYLVPRRLIAISRYLRVLRHFPVFSNVLWLS